MRRRIGRDVVKYRDRNPRSRQCGFRILGQASGANALVGHQHDATGAVLLDQFGDFPRGTGLEQEVGRRLKSEGRHDAYSRRKTIIFSWLISLTVNGMPPT